MDRQPSSGMFPKKSPNYPSSPSAIPPWWGLVVSPFHGVQLNTDKTDSNLLHTPRRIPAHWRSHCDQLIWGSRELNSMFILKKQKMLPATLHHETPSRNVCWTFIQKELCHFFALKIKKPNLRPWQWPRCLCSGCREGGENCMTTVQNPPLLCLGKKRIATPQRMVNQIRTFKKPEKAQRCYLN